MTIYCGGEYENHTTRMREVICHDSKQSMNAASSDFLSHLQSTKYLNQQLTKAHRQRRTGTSSMPSEETMSLQACRCVVGRVFQNTFWTLLEGRSYDNQLIDQSCVLTNNLSFPPAILFTPITVVHRKNHQRINMIIIASWYCKESSLQEIDKQKVCKLFLYRRNHRIG